MSEHHQPGGTAAALLLETPLTTVTAPDYRKLRLLAECAVGMPNQPRDFYFRGGETLERRGAGETMADDDVLVPTQDRGKFPGNYVGLTLTGSSPDDAPDLPQGVCDALFWSDASVQKFLFPYLASCGGDDAGAVLADVQRAWNGYPPQFVTVYALAHVASFAPEVPLDLESSIGVVYADAQQPNAKLQAAGLAEFIQYLDTLPPPMIVAAELPGVKYMRGGAAGTPQRPGYLELRALAEWAASLRDQPLYFVFRAGRKGFDVPLPSSIPPLNDGDFVIPAFTPTVPAGRPTLGGVWFQPADTDDVGNLADAGDALFWSTSAIDKFVIPYYASKGGMETLPDLMDIAAVWDDPEVYSLIHLPNSEWAQVEIDQAGSVQTGPGHMEIATPHAGHHTVRRLEPRHQLGVVTRRRLNERPDSVARYLKDPQPPHPSHPAHR